MSIILYSILSFLALIIFAKTNIGQAITRRLRSGDISVANRLSDAANDGQLALEDAKGELTTLKSALADLVKENNKVEAQLAEARANVEKFERIAQLAGQAGNANDVKEALEQKAQAASLAESLVMQVNENEQMEKQMRAEIEDYDKKIKRAQSDSARYIAQIKGAEVRQSIAQRRQNIKKDGLAGLDLLKERAADATAGAQAWEELGNVGGDVKALEDKYSNASTVEDAEVAKYMKKETSAA